MSPSKSEEARPGSPRVLVAEDEALIRLDLVELLTGEGYEVVGQAGDGEEAIALARELRPDLVVMDGLNANVNQITSLVGHANISGVFPTFTKLTLSNMSMGFSLIS